MSVAVLGRMVAPGASAWRNAVVVLIAAAAIMVGLLAMHALNLHEGHDSAPVSSSTTSHHAAGMPAHGSIATADNCVGPCVAGDEVVSMSACILALLSTAVLVVAALSAARWQIPTSWAAALARATALAPPSPPSLHVLSISRT